MKSAASDGPAGFAIPSAIQPPGRLLGGVVGGLQDGLQARTADGDAPRDFGLELAAFVDVRGAAPQPWSARGERTPIAEDSGLSLPHRGTNLPDASASVPLHHKPEIPSTGPGLVDAAVSPGGQTHNLAPASASLESVTAEAAGTKGERTAADPLRLQAAAHAALLQPDMLTKRPGGTDKPAERRATTGPETVSRAPASEATPDTLDADLIETARKSFEGLGANPRPASLTVQASAPQLAPAPEQPSGTSASAPSLAPASAQPALQPSTAASELRADPRLAPQIETAIEQLADTRQAARTARPEILMRHGDFGLVSMRLDASGGDLRATLIARDPGFVPAVQAALAERVVAAASESANTSGQRGQEQSSQSGANSNGSGTAQGHSFAQNYGSSPGSSQGSSQPRMHHQEEASGEPSDQAGNAAQGAPDTSRGAGGVFA